MRTQSAKQVTKFNPFGDLETLEQAFHESTYPYIGCELEFPMICKRTGRPLPRFDEVHEALPEQVRRRIDGEFLKCQIELKTDPHRRVSDIVHQMYYTIEAVRSVLSRHEGDITWKSLIPNCKFDEKMIRDCERSWLNVERFGDLVENLGMCGMHVHVAVSHDQAIPVADAMQQYLPLLVALGANSPLKTGNVTRASQRAFTWSHELSTTSFPYYHKDWKSFREYTNRLQSAGVVESQKSLYTFARLSRFSTIEFRLFDVPLDLDHMAGLIALTQTLVKHEQLESVPKDLDPLLHANMIQAVTYGREAKFYDISGERQSVETLTRKLIAELKNTAVQLDCFDELQLLFDVFDRPTVTYVQPKGKQRVQWAIQVAALATISAMPFFIFG